MFENLLVTTVISIFLLIMAAAIILSAGMTLYIIYPLYIPLALEVLPSVVTLALLLGVLIKW